VCQISAKSKHFWALQAILTHRQTDTQIDRHTDRHTYIVRL